jgi:hypothetical protein
MDPYLEEPTLWPGVHHSLITYIRDVLQAVLPPRYYLEIVERLYFETPSRGVYPDVAILRSRTEPGGGVSVLEPDQPVVVELDVRHLEPFIEIRAVRTDEVVAVLEVISPANKWPGSKGREEYLSKQDRVLASAVHLIEIDLLRRGAPVVVGALTGWSLPAFDYLAGVNRAADRFRTELYPFTVRDRLPRMSIPLQDPDPDVTLDLPAVFTRCYDNGTYGRRLDYNQPTPEPLRPEDAEWADSLLRAAGVRKTPPAAAEEQG